MDVTTADTAFLGTIPEAYDRHLVPLLFKPYADDLAARAALRAPGRVLEIAAGTGAVTRELAKRLREGTVIIATDLNAPMIDHAALIGTVRPVEWRVADAMHLPFEDASFDLVICQFGVMFFPDKVHALREARRVLKPGAPLLFNVWDRIERNDFADAVTEALRARFPDDPPQFMARVPHGYCDETVIARDIAAAGFVQLPVFKTVTVRARVASAEVPAVAFCQGLGRDLRKILKTRI